MLETRGSCSTFSQLTQSTFDFHCGESKTESFMEFSTFSVLLETAWCCLAFLLASLYLQFYILLSIEEVEVVGGYFQHLDNYLGLVNGTNF